MTEDWAATQREVYNDLKAEGVMFSFTRRGGDKPDPITGRSEDNFSRTFFAPGIVKTAGGKEVDFWARNGTPNLVQLGDDVLLVAAMTYSPRLEDRVKTGKEVWTIKAISTLRPALVPLLHHLLIRKG